MTTHRTGRPTRTLALRAVALLAVLLAALTACGGGSADSEAMSSADYDAAGGTEVAERPRADAGAADAPRSQGAAARASDAVPERKIATGSIALRGRDVAAVRADVQQVVDDLGGEVAEERTDTRRDGTVVHSRLVLRLPTDAFPEAMTAIEGLADLRSSRQGTDVVTDEYVDLQARVRAQERSLRRVEVLFSRAEDIRDIMAIEGELSRRQADLDSLKGQLRYLEDQTSFATVTVNIERTPRAGAGPEPDDDGFLAGLASGWAGLTAVLTGLATVAGAVLPFAVLLVLVGAPLALLVRRLRRNRLRPTPAAG